MEGMEVVPSTAVAAAEEFVFPVVLDTTAPSNSVDDARHDEPRGDHVEPARQPLQPRENVVIYGGHTIQSTIAPQRNDERAFIEGWLSSILSKKEAQMALSFFLASQGIPGEPAYDLHQLGIGRESLSNDTGLGTSTLDNLYRGLHLHSVAFRQMIVKEAGNLSSRLASQTVQRNDADVAYIQQKAESSFLKIYNGFNLAHFAIVSALVDMPNLNTDEVPASGALQKAHCNEGDLRLLLEAKGGWELKVQMLQRVIEKEREGRRYVQGLHDQASQDLEKTQQGLQVEKDAHQETSQKLGGQIHGLEAECAQLKVDLEKSMEKTSLEKQAHQATKAKFASDMILCEELKEKNQSLNATLQIRQAEIAQRDGSIADLQQSILDRDQLIADKGTELDTMQNSIDSLEELLNAERARAKAIQTLFEEESDRADQMQTRNEEMEKECENLRKDSISQSAELVKLAADLEKKEKEISEFKEKTKKLLEEIRSTQRREKNLNAMVKDLNNRHPLREKNAMHIEEDQAMMLQYIRRQQKEVKEMARKVVGSEKITRKALAKDSVLHQKLEEASTHLEAKTATAENLLLDLDSARSAVTKAEAVVDELRIELKNSRAIVKLHESTIEEQDKELGIMRRANLSLKGKQQKATTELQAIKKESLEESERLQGVAARCEEEMRKSEAECASLRSSAAELVMLKEIHMDTETDLQDTKEQLDEQRHTLEEANKTKGELQDRLSRVIKDFSEARRKIQTLETNLSTLSESYDKQIAMHKETVSEFQAVKARNVKILEDQERTYRELAQMKKRYDVQSEEKKDLERRLEELKVAHATGVAQVQKLEERTELAEKALLSHLSKNNQYLSDLSQSLDELNNGRDLMIQYVGEMKVSIQTLGAYLPKDVMSKADIALLYAELTQQTDQLEKQLMGEYNTESNVTVRLGLCRQEMDSSIRSQKELMEEVRNVRVKSTGAMVSQDAGDQSGWASTENWLTEEREKQKARMNERDTAPTIDTAKTSAVRRADEAEDRAQALELDLKLLEKKLQSAFEALEAKGTKCMEYAMKYKDAQMRVEKEQEISQNLQDQLQEIRLENQELKSKAQSESQILVNKCHKEMVARRWREKYMHDLSKRLVVAQNRLKAIGALDVESRASQTEAAEIWIRNAQTAPKAAQSLSMKDLRRLWTSKTPAAALLPQQQESSRGGQGTSLLSDPNNCAGRWLSRKVVVDTIFEIYAAKIKHDALAFEELREPIDLGRFTHLYFAEKYGLLELTEQRLGEFSAAVMHHQQSIWEVAQFGLGAGILGDGTSLCDEVEPPEGVARVLNRGANSMDELALNLTGHSGSALLQQRSIDIDNSIQSSMYSQPLIRHKRLMGLSADDVNAHPLASKLLSERPPKRKLCPDRLAEELSPLLVHPIALDAISVAGRDAGAGWVLDRGCDPMLFEHIRDRLDMGVLIAASQLPQLQFLVREACEMLQMPLVQVYILEHPRPTVFPWCLQTSNASDIGPTCRLVLTSCLMDLLEPAELQAVIAGNLGLLKNQQQIQHPSEFLCYVRGITAARWHLMVSPLPDMHISDNLRATVWLLSQALSFCADRAALIAIQDPRIVASAALKVAAGVHTLCNQLNLDAVWEQARQLNCSTIGSSEGSHNVMAKLPRIEDIFKNSQSLVVFRLREIERWVASSEYNQAFEHCGGGDSSAQ